VRLHPTPATVYRVGGSAHVWSLPPWNLGPFNGRWDDPDQTYRVRYVAPTPYGALVEKIARFRVDLDLLVAMAEVESEEPVPMGLPPLPSAWTDENVLAVSELDIAEDRGLVDLATGEGMAAAHASIESARRRSGHIIRDYDAAVLLSGNPRSFTQAISRYAYDAGFAGIVYRSRYAPDELCAALFEGRHALVDPRVAPIELGHVDLARALAVHHLILPRVVAIDGDRE
jgi:hypothetical protein